MILTSNAHDAVCILKLTIVDDALLTIFSLQEYVEVSRPPYSIHVHHQSEREET